MGISKKDWGRLGRLRLRYKLFLMYCLVIIIPLWIAGLYLSREIQSIMINQAVAEANTNMDRIENRINHVFDRVAYISVLASADVNLHIWANYEFRNNLEIFNMYIDPERQLFDDFLNDQGIPLHDEIFDIRFYTFNPTALNAGRIFRVTEEVAQSHWFETAIANEGQITWMFKTDELTGREHFILTRLIIDPDTDAHLGILNIYISNHSLRGVFQNEPDEIELSLTHEAVVFYENEILIGGNSLASQLIESESDLESLLDHLEADETVEINARNVTLRGFMDNEIQIVSIIPTHQVIEQVNLVLQRVFLVVGACLLFSATLILIFIKQFHDRVNAVKGAMNQVARGNFDISPTIRSKDEIGEIYEHLYKTMTAMQQLMEDNLNHRIQTEQWRLKQKESEFKRLSSQINPHFLYNTLEMIRVGVLKSGATDIAEIVSLLGTLLRRSLETGEKAVPISGELEFIRMYLQIQQVRFKDKLTYHIHCDVSETHKIMPLLIQPIVENAFVHGVEMKKGHSEISIFIYEKRDLLIIEVVDNGLGIPPKELAEFNKMLDEVEGVDPDSIGLKNIVERIKLYYGKPYGMFIESEENQGTKVTLLLPKEDHQDA